MPEDSLQVGRVVCRVIGGYVGLMAVDVTHLLGRRWNTSFLVVSKTPSMRSRTEFDVSCRKMRCILSASSGPEASLTSCLHLL